MDDAFAWDTVHKKTHHEEKWHSGYAEEVEKNFPAGGLVVDLGAGTGGDALYFLQKGHRVVALDISQFALDVLVKKAKSQNLDKGLAVKQADFGLHKLPIKDASADSVYSRISLNYFESKHTTKIFSDIYRILKPGCSAYLTFKSPDDPVEMEYLEKNATPYEPNVFIEGGMIRSRFTNTQLKEMLKNAGLQEFQVIPKKEELGDRREGHHPELYINEVLFTKK